MNDPALPPTTHASMRRSGVETVRTVYRRLRASFATRLTLVLVGLVTFMSGSMLLLVGHQTTHQVREVTLRAAEISRAAFQEVEELHRVQLARLALGFTGSRRTLAALEAALESGERDWLVETARYEMELARLESGFAAFSDVRGNIVAALVDDVSMDQDPADVAAVGRAAIAGDSMGVTAYRVIGGRLFVLTAERVELAGRPIGAVTFGVPLEGRLVDHLAQAAGVQVCFTGGRRCIAGTSGTDSALIRLMSAGSAGASGVVFSSDGRRWMLAFEDVTPAGIDPAVQRVIAVPLDRAVAPFERIRTTLVWIGIGAFPLAVGLGILLSSRLSRPVRALVRGTERVARGDLTVRIGACGSDELGMLAASFNTMVDELSLKERYHDVLSKVMSRAVANDLLAGRLELGGELRTVSVVFADIVGFTSLAEETPPRTVIAALNEFMTEWSGAVHEEGGVVDKYTGDGIMAIFGAPISHEDDATRAVRAAVRIQEAALRINERRRARELHEVALAIGIATGPAVAGNVGSPDRLNYTVIGASVNLAARLCSAAGPGQILVADETVRAVNGSFEVTGLGTRLLKGMSRPVPVFAIAAGDAPTTAASFS